MLTASYAGYLKMERHGTRFATMLQVCPKMQQQKLTLVSREHSRLAFDVLVHGLIEDR